MVNPNKGRALLPLPVIEAARAGNAEAVEQVLRYYKARWSRPTPAPPAGGHGAAAADIQVKQ